MVDEGFVSLETDSPITKKPGPATTARRIQRSELSLDINDILALELEEPILDTRQGEKELNPEKKKCWPTVLGGADMQPGCSTIGSPRVCSALHCRDCDLSVSSFPHHEWTERVEYLFLRTNMPNFEKISEKLRRKEGTVAYACHCVSFSADQLRPLHEDLSTLIGGSPQCLSISLSDESLLIRWSLQMLTSVGVYNN